MAKQENTLQKFVLEIIEAKQPQNQQVSPLDSCCLIAPNPPLSHENFGLTLDPYGASLRFQDLIKSLSYKAVIPPTENK